MSQASPITPIDPVPGADSGSPAPELSVWLATAATFIAAAAFNLWIGLIVFMGDSYLLADRAKHLILAGNLNLNNELGSLVYPPLYPILISPAYLSASPSTSFQLILLIHSVMVACQVWPLFKLLTEYSKVPSRTAAWLAAAFALAPFTLPYAAMMLTEVAYIPLLLWMTYFFLRNQEDGKIADAIRSGCFLGLMLLVRSAATTILVALIGAFLFSIWRARSDAALLRKRALGLAVSVFSFAAVYLIWKSYEALFVQYGARGSYFTSDEVRLIFAERTRFDHHFSWFTNTIFYFLTAPLSIAGCFFYSLLFRRPRKLLRDSLFPFAILALTVSAVTVVLIMTKGWGGRELTWNKYLAPYVFLILLCAARYRSWFTRAEFRSSALVLSLIFLAFKPSGLGCHFTDALVLFTSNTNPLLIPETIANVLFLVAILLPAWLWLGNSPRHRAAAIGLTGMLWVASLFGTASYYRNSGDLNISRYEGAAKQALALAQTTPNTKVFYDPAFAAKDMFGALRILFYWPALMSPLKADQLAAMTAQSPAPVIYFSTDDLSGVKHLAEDRGAVRFYSVTAGALGAPTPPTKLLPAAAGTSLKPIYSADVAGVESSTWQGRPYSVRWLRQSTLFVIDNPGAPLAASISMQLGVATSHHSVQLEANGELAGEKPLITKVLWAHGPQDVAFSVNLKSGRNNFKLVSPDKPDVLPGGREVCCLQIGDIVVTVR